MKVIVAGGRNITDWGEVVRGIEASGFKFTEIVHGGCPTGVDSMADGLATLNGYEPKVFRADWDKYGKAAGPIRNREMAEYADALIAIWDGKSRGTGNMISEMRLQLKPVYIHWVKSEEV